MRPGEHLSDFPGTGVSSVPGLVLLRDWVTPADEGALLASIDAAPWRGDLKRRVQHYGFRYDYKARAVDESMRLGPLPGWAEELSSRILREGFSERAPDQVIVNEYLPGQGISRHVDCVPCFGPVVLSLSLGSQCVMELSAPDTHEPVLLPLPARSLLVLSGEARTRWAHAIPGRKSDMIAGVRVPRERRVSLTFRTVRLSASWTGASPAGNRVLRERRAGGRWGTS
jgi:alkylated DNA repair dioxygenase AlkB